MASAIALDVVRTKRPEPATSAGEAEWAAPLPEPELTAGADSSGDPFASDPVETAAEEEPPALPELEYPGEHALQADPEYATRTQENLPMATDETSRGPDPFGAPATARRRTPVLGVAAHPTPGGADRVLPPSLFADQALTDLEAAPPGGSTSEADISQDMRSDDINDMFAEHYHVSRPPVTPAPMPGRPSRQTPALGTPGPGRATPINSREQYSPRSGRPVTPVLGAQAITPISVPQIRRTPLAPSIAIREPAAANVPSALSPHQMVERSTMSSLTPAVVPALQDLAASRVIAYALETVANRIRAGQIEVAGQVPSGDDVASLAAAVAAALAALLGVQR